MKKDISHEYLLSILEYNPKTGDWTWLVNRSNKIKAGKKAGCNKNGYIQITIDWKIYCAHILAWFYMTREWPEKEIDHKNRIRNDNRWENLRQATDSQQEINKEISATNTSGYKGVSLYKKKYIARIKKDSKIIYIGYFTCPIKAAKAYDKKAIEIYGDYAKTNFT